VIQREARLSLVPAHPHLGLLESELARRPAGAESLLRGLLESARWAYHWVILDCAPSLGWITVNGLVAADGVLIPQVPDTVSIRGLGELIGTLGRLQPVRRSLELPPLQVAGVFLTRVRYTAHHATVRDQIAAFCGAQGLPFLSTEEAAACVGLTPPLWVVDTIAAADAAGMEIPLSRYAEGREAMEAYRRLARWLHEPR
jgi:chromosome partitioning protein